jgi:hypothetical protein
MTLTLDHVIFGCLDLESGAAHLSDLFGASPAGRGVHAMMGTHNALWNMGQAYIELVAVNPAAPHPGRPRWFGLDDPATLARLSGGPRLLTWAIAGQAAAAVAAAAPMPIGPMEAFARDDLEWQVAVPEDGRPGLDGIYPLTLHWTAGVHPAKRLGDQGLRCRSLHLAHPQITSLTNAVRTLPDCVSAETGPPQITCEIEAGTRLLRFEALS